MSEFTHPSPETEEHKKYRLDHPHREAQKHPHTVLEQQLHQAEEELRRSTSSLFLSSFSAGLDLGFGIFGVAIILSRLKGVWPQPVVELLSANAYSLGFILVVLARSSLFTEHTTSAVLPVLAGRVGVVRLLRLWAVVLVGNLVGSVAFSYVFLSKLGPALGIIERPVLGELAWKMVESGGWVMFGSAVAAGWLMGLLTWLVSAGRDTIGQIAFVWMITVLIGIGGLHHSIAGTVEVLGGVFAGSGVSGWHVGKFLVWAVMGNAVGGATFVASLKYAHLRQGAEQLP